MNTPKDYANWIQQLQWNYFITCRTPYRIHTMTVRNWLTKLLQRSKKVEQAFYVTERDKELVVTAKDRIHTYLGGGLTLSINDNFSVKPSVMLRKVQGLPLSADLTGFLSIQNRVDFGLSYRTNASMSFLAFLSVYNGLDIGYAYETPSEQMLSGISLKTHELVLRIRLGSGTQTQTDQEPSGSPVN